MKARPIAACCPLILHAGGLSPPAALELAAAFKVLADAARVRLLSVIASRPNGEACVCELTEPLGLTQPTVSHHLKILHDAGLLTRDRRGLWVWYRVQPERLASLRAALGTPAVSDAGAAREAPAKGRKRA